MDEIDQGPRGPGFSRLPARDMDRATDICAPARKHRLQPLKGPSRRSTRCAEDNHRLALDPREGNHSGVDRGRRVTGPYRTSDDDDLVAGDVYRGRLDISTLSAHGSGRASEVPTHLRVSGEISHLDLIAPDRGDKVFGDGPGVPGLRMIDDADGHTGVYPSRA